jgi:ABC-type uncharacterized transport system substrate-binding protein
MRRIFATAAMLCALSAPALAHPHVFVDTGLRLIFDDQGRLAAVRVTWAYDELFSLLVLEDRELDKDYDGKLTEAEQAALKGFDMDWPDWFEGDLFLTAGGEKIEMSGPMEITATLADSRIVTTHLRALETRLEVGEQPVVFQVYDPGYYTGYEISLPVKIIGREGCAAKVFMPDLDAAQKELQDALAEYTPSEDLEEMGWPAVGASFAEEVRLTCAPSS